MAHVPTSWPSVRVTRPLALAPQPSIGMRLDRTLSPHGPVTRGWCQIRDGRVLQIEEVTEIERRDGQITGAGRRRPLTFDGSEMVSMNFWVFPPSVFGMVGARFDAFLEREGNDPAAEFLLPEAINELVATGELTLHGLEAPGPWFGLTYRDDLPAVTAGIAAADRSKGSIGSESTRGPEGSCACGTGEERVKSGVKGA